MERPADPGDVLREGSANSLDGIFKNMPVALCLCELRINDAGSEDLRIVMVNDAFSALYGEPAKNAEGELFTAVCPMDAGYLPSYIDVIKMGKSVAFEEYHPYFGKRLRYNAFSPIPGQAAIIITDSSDFVSAGEPPRPEAGELSFLFAAMPCGFCLGRIIRDKEDRPVDAFFEMTNGAFDRMESPIGISLQGRSLFESNPNADRSHLDIYANVVSNRKQISFRKLVPVTGATLDVVCYSPMEGLFACIQNDITDRAASERKLQMLYTGTEAILYEIPAPICVVDANSGSVLDCNAAFIQICSQDAGKKLVGSHISESFGKSSCGASVLELLKKGKSFKCQLLSRPESEALDVEIFSRPFMYNGRFSFVLFCVDLTRQEAQERALREVAAAAEEASRMKSHFLANISHEIRTPLNGVLGFAELALDDPYLTDSSRDYVNKIIISAGGLLEIINDILDFSKIEAGKVKLEETPFSLGDVFRYCEASINQKARAKGLKAYFCPDPVTDKRLIGDPIRLRQILLNLLSNAVKFTDSGMVALNSSILEESESRITVLFEVKDSGIGMTKEQMERVFNLFMQADNAPSRKYGGTGLGLVITRSLVEMMGGRLNADSAPGVGSRFSFSLDFDTISGAPESGPAREPGRTGSKKPVFYGEALVFEDSLFNQQVVSEHLKRVGITAVIAGNGKEGVAIAEERIKTGKFFDIVLMDIHMPEMDGVEAARRLVDMGVTVPIVAMTADILARDMKLYMESGMSDYLGKPFTSGDLWACLSRHLRPVFLEDEDASNETIPSEAPPNETVATLAGTTGEVNMEQGLLNAAGDESFYRRLLALFSRSNADFCVKLRDAVNSGDAKLAYRMVHTIKTVSATIGAQRLSELAAGLEKTLSDESLNHTPEQLAALEHEMTAVLRELEPFAEQQPRKPKPHTAFEKPSSLISKLKPLLVSGNTDCLELLGEIHQILSYAGESCGELVSLVEDYDFEQALEVLARISNMPEGSE